jgi:hypothetical protein
MINVIKRKKGESGMPSFQRHQREAEMLKQCHIISIDNSIVNKIKQYYYITLETKEQGRQPCPSPPPNPLDYGGDKRRATTNCWVFDPTSVKPKYDNILLVTEGRVPIEMELYWVLL